MKIILICSLLFILISCNNKNYQEDAHKWNVDTKMFLKNLDLNDTLNRGIVNHYYFQVEKYRKDLLKAINSFELNTDLSKYMIIEKFSYYRFGYESFVMFNNNIDCCFKYDHNNNQLKRTSDENVIYDFSKYCDSNNRNEIDLGNELVFLSIFSVFSLESKHMETKFVRIQ